MNTPESLHSSDASTFFARTPAGLPVWGRTIFALSLLLVAIISLIDYFTGVHVRIFPLYYLSIAFGAYFLSMKAGLFLAVLSSIAWVLSNLLIGLDSFGPVTWGVNITTMALSFLLIAFLIGRLRQGLLRERDLSRRDLLTGLHNSRAFYEFGSFLISGSQRRQAPLTLGFIDLDNFKAVNDKLGHHEGDQVLREAGRLLQEHFRKSDLVARLGGDEFAVLLPDTGEEAATLVLERLRARMQEAMTHRGLPVTMSIGAVFFPQAPATLEEAVHAADELMYVAKREGKNRLHIVSHEKTE
ncbi:GGDEF domain-containing protein [Myxococcota bacterium]|nr:GGDEF domain-containing protein [Myxococcota bacterium]